MPAPFNTRMSPTRALEQATEALAPSYRVVSLSGSGPAKLLSDVPDLPDLELRLEREPGLFSRTFALSISARVEGQGPAQDLTLRLGRHGLRRRMELRAEPTSAAADDWPARFEHHGLLAAALRMTSVQELTMEWRPRSHAWRLRLRTLAGALIGTSPSTWVAVPFEPEDLDGLFGTLRAFRRAATEATSV
jgi:hypothetical protein